MTRSPNPPAPAVRHITLRMTTAEMLELMRYRALCEQASGRPLALQAVLRSALITHSEATIDVKPYIGLRSKRIDLVANASVQAALKHLQANPGHEYAAITDLVLGCVRLAGSRV